MSDHLFVELTCSVGFTLFPRTVSPGEYQWEQVVAVADLALYEAKSGGRNLVVGLVPDEDDPLGVLAAVESEGRRLLEDRRLRPLGDEAARPDSGRG